MCIAVPLRIVAIKGPWALVEGEGVRQRVRLDVVPEAQVGDYVLVHAGLAISRVDFHQAQEILNRWRELSHEVS